MICCTEHLKIRATPSVTRLIFVLHVRVCANNMLVLEGDIAREKDFKPGGQPADFRSVSVMMALRSTASSDFKGLKQCWLGTLLQEGLLFREKSTGKLLPFPRTRAARPVALEGVSSS